MIREKRVAERRKIAERFSAWMSERMSAPGAPNQSELAQALDVSRQSVWNWMAGNGLPSFAEMMRLCRVLGLETLDVGTFSD